MKKALLITYDLVRDGEHPVTLSAGSLLAYLKQNVYYGKEFIVDHLPINLLKVQDKNYYLGFEGYLDKRKILESSAIAISCFVWNEYLINPLILYLRSIGFTGRLILGGSQITYSNSDNLQLEYPEADCFISGYGEDSLLRAILDTCSQKVYRNELDIKNLPSPFLTDEISLSTGEKMIRWETKRGCPYACSFCAHRNLENGRVNYLYKDKIMQELDLFNSKRIKRINVLDPIFNMGSDYIGILKEINRLKFNETSFTFQSKIELLDNPNGKEFLDLVEKVNAHLEFGLQTINELEYKIIERRNNIQKIKNQLRNLRERNTSYEVSLIYGLPGQTVSSFMDGIYFLYEQGVKKITAWPLMLLKGTKLFTEKDKYSMKEEIIGDFNIPVVTSTFSFNKDDWYDMKEIADKISITNRY